MTEEKELELHQQELPTEILYVILTYLPVKDLINCRRVCAKWRDIVDHLIKTTTLWHDHCMQDFKHMFLQTRHRLRKEISGYQLYRAFRSWSKLRRTVAVQEEFAQAENIIDEIISFVLLPNDVIGVHTKSAIEYYNSNTFQKITRRTVYGSFMKYNENKEVLVVLDSNQILYITRKFIYNNNEEFAATYAQATNFLLVDGKVYYIKNNSKLFLCKYHDRISYTYINSCKEDIVSLGYKDNTLYFVTAAKNIYKLVGTKLVIVCSLNNSNSLLHTLSQYNLLMHLNGQMYSEWMLHLSRIIPEGPLRALIVVHVYGDVVFIGTIWGILKIYYAPYTNGELNFKKAKPVKEFNFMEADTCPAVTTKPIMHIEVIEGEDEHTVLVALPKKIAVIKFKPNLEETPYFKKFFFINSLKQRWSK